MDGWMSYFFFFWWGGGGGGETQSGVSRAHEIDPKETTDTRNDKSILFKTKGRFIFTDQIVIMKV